ncbi:hypothetical protein Tco_0285237, partial [Tanacetum coccineum]
APAKVDSTDGTLDGTLADAADPDAILRRWSRRRWGGGEMESAEVEGWRGGEVESNTYLENLKGELSSVEAENAKLSDQVENLMMGYLEDSMRLQSNLEGLNSSLEFIQSQSQEDLETKKADARLECSSMVERQPDYDGEHGGCKFKILELNRLIEKKHDILKTLKNLDYTFRRCEGVLKIEDALTGLEVIEYEGNQIRFSLRTYIPNTDLPEQNHELAIELWDDTLELRNTENFPNDVSIGEIMDAAKHQFSLLPMPENKNSLECGLYENCRIESFKHIQEVFGLGRKQVKVLNYQKNIRNGLRMDGKVVEIVVGSRKKSPDSGYEAEKDEDQEQVSWDKLSIEYEDKDEMIVAHMVDGVDAFIKVSQGWPIILH